MFYGGLTYNSHPLACAAALATIAVYEEDDLIERARQMGAVMTRHMRDLEARHPIVGAVRSIGLFGIVELVAGPDDDGAAGAVQRHSEPRCGARAVLPPGRLYTFVRWNTFFTNPPLTITEDELAQASRSSIAA